MVRARASQHSGGILAGGRVRARARARASQDGVLAAG